MKKLIPLFCILALLITSPVMAFSDSMRIGVTVLSMPVGATGIGIYTDLVDFFLGAGTTNLDLSSGGDHFTPVRLTNITGQLAIKAELLPGTYGNLGFMAKFISGDLLDYIDFDTYIIYGLFIGLQQMIGHNVMVSCQYFPLVVSNIEIEGLNIDSTSFGNSLGILGIGIGNSLVAGMSWLF
ncbi:hypothetical protein ACFL96_01395 [Thermoproteota archaeon]